MCIRDSSPRDANEFNNYKKDNWFLASYSIDNVPPKIASVSKALAVTDIIEKGGFEVVKTNFKAIKAQFKETGIIQCPEKILPSLKEAIKEVYNKDRPSKSKLSKKDFAKEYEWHTTITNWFGDKDIAFAFYKELTGKDA